MDRNTHKRIKSALGSPSAGERHAARLRAAKLAGGLVCGAGAISQAEALDFLKKLSDEISDNSETSQGEWKSILEAFEHGLKNPISSLKTNDQGKIVKSLDNVAIALDNFNLSGMFIGYDYFTDQIMFDRGHGRWECFEDKHYLDLRINLSRTLNLEVSKELMSDAVAVVAYKHHFDSAKNWINSLKWDGIKRVDRLFVDYFGAEDKPYSYAVSKYLMTAAAGRCLKPGIQADMAPILVGDQGVGKSTGIAALVPEPSQFKEFNFHDKDDDNSRKIRGCIIGELAELQGLRKKEVESVKAFITRKTEKWIPKFKEMETEYSRRVIFVGTTNSDEFLSDSTGNRRFLPIRVYKVDREAIQRDRNQLWAEAAVLFKANGIAWQDAQELAKEEHDEFLVEDVLEHYISNYLKIGIPDHVKKTSIHDIMLHLSCLSSVKFDNITKNRVANVLKKLKYEKSKKRARPTLWFYTI